MKRATLTDIQAGQPLPWSIYDRRGNLLLCAGFVLSTAAAAEKIVARGAFINESDYANWLSPTGERLISNSPSRSLSRNAQMTQSLGPVFHRVPEALYALHRVQQHALNYRPEAFKEALDALAAELVGMFTQDEDALLAALHLTREKKHHRLAHQMLGAVAILLMCEQMAIPHDETFILVCAALTRDLGLLKVDAAMHKSGLERPDSAMQSEIRSHTQATLNYLVQLGVSERLWLEAIQDHHERLDGSGYPAGKTAVQLGGAARMMAIADSYAAMVGPGGKNKNVAAGNALREVFTQATLYDQQMVGALFKGLTLYPPGSFVKLAQGEIAVVKEKLTATQPIVFSLFTADGLPRVEPFPRNTKQPEFQIVGADLPCRHHGILGLVRKTWST